MNIASLGTTMRSGRVEAVELDSSRSLLDFDLVILDASGLLSSAYWSTYNGEFQGYPNLDDNASVRFREDIARRGSELRELLRLGRTVVAFTPPPQKCYVATGDREVSGTGRNQKITRLVDSFDILSVLPTGSVNTVKASGGSLDLVSNDERFQLFWDAVSENLGYEAYFKEAVGEPWINVGNTDRVVATHALVESGHMLFIPDVWGPDGTDDAGWTEIFDRVVDALVELAAALRKETGDFSLPSWTARYALPDELEARRQLGVLEEQLSATQERIDATREDLARQEQWKVLLTGTGPALELLVSRSFEELGFAVGESLPGRSDITLRLGRRPVVVEVKGLTKSAAEKHAAQLEKWASEFLELNGKRAKPVLVVNAYRERPLSDREDAFPDQMLSYATSRDHCLITTTQLLAAVIESRRSARTRQELARSIVSTTGIYDRFTEWPQTILVPDAS